MHDVKPINQIVCILKFRSRNLKVNFYVIGFEIARQKNHVETCNSLTRRQSICRHDLVSCYINILTVKR